MLIHVAINHIKSHLLERYRLQIDFKGFDEIFNAAQSYAKLFDLAWMVNVLLGELTDEWYEEWFQTKFKYLLRELQEIRYQLTAPPLDMERCRNLSNSMEL